jgi:hypothetical protein
LQWPIPELRVSGDAFPDPDASSKFRLRVASMHRFKHQSLIAGARL